MKNWIYILLIGVIPLFQCKTQSASSGKTETNQTAGHTVATPYNSVSLVDYLRRVPGVQVTGPSSNPVIRVRVSYTLTQDSEPLFVIDRNIVGNSYNTAASLVDVNDISSVTVLKDVASTSAYGMQGANGVIIIKTKKTASE